MKSAPILIIDKTGLIGEPLSLKLSKEFPVVLISKWKKFPVITDNKYSHIIFIADENGSLEFLPQIIKKAKGINSGFIFAQDMASKDIYAEKVLGLYSSSKVVLYGDIFGNKLILRTESFKSVINKFIYQGKMFGKIQILGDGLRMTHPVFINDVVDGLIDLVFGMNDKHSLFYLFPKHPVTELSLAHMIQKANPQINIDFIRSDPRKGIVHFPQNGKYLLEDKYALSKKIRAIDIYGNPPAGATNEGKENTQTKYKGKKSFSLKILWVLIFLFISPLIFALFFSFLGLNTLYLAKEEIDRGNFIRAKSSLRLSNTFFYVGRQASKALHFQAKIIGRENNLKRFSQNLELGHKISQGVLYAFDSEIYFSKIFSGKSDNPVDDFSKWQNYLKSSIVILEKIKAEGKVSDSFLQKLEVVDPFIKLLSNASDVLPNIVGIEGQRTYLVLFQNNMELRPGGGFIGSYGILKINLGKITEFTIHDVYDADGQLKGHLEPPFAIRRYLPSAHWYMRDGNFDIDFVKAASASSNFLYVETGVKSDGVIGVDVSFVKNILHAIGPVYVPDYKENVDENNLYIITQSHAEKNFFPGSTQKKDFLRSLYRAIMDKISQHNVPYLSVAQAISDSLVQKHLLFAFNDNTQNIFTVNGWSSSLWDERIDDEKSVNDFLGIIEANLGVNKVNYFISRKIDHKVAIEDNGSISEELNISYKNASTSWPGGGYKNYLRIILPEDANISEISIQNVSQVLIDAITDPLIYEAKDFKPPPGLEVEKVNDGNKTIYGFIVNIPVGEIIKIKIKYALKNNVSNLNNFSYNLKLFKQPGIDNLPYSFSLEFPNSFNVIEGTTSYSKKIVRDENLIVGFAKK
ncbi:MAG: DUF4012 domain-containing protein [Candidatus Levybacteria bacterium]|nr:DUF4012 domain-containing protein [Candidatus Levybacteria bacterium]